MQRKDLSDELILSLIELRAKCQKEFPALSFGSIVIALSSIGVPVKVVEAKLLDMDKRGIIDYGTSLWYPWSNNER